MRYDNISKVVADTIDRFINEDMESNDLGKLKANIAATKMRVMKAYNVIRRDFSSFDSLFSVMQRSYKDYPNELFSSICVQKVWDMDAKKYNFNWCRNVPDTTCKEDVVNIANRSEVRQAVEQYLQNEIYPTVREYEKRMDTLINNVQSDCDALDDVALKSMLNEICSRRHHSLSVKLMDFHFLKRYDIYRELDRFFEEEHPIEDGVVCVLKRMCMDILIDDSVLILLYTYILALLDYTRRYRNDDILLYLKPSIESLLGNINKFINRL